MFSKFRNILLNAQPQDTQQSTNISIKDKEIISVYAEIDEILAKYNKSLLKTSGQTIECIKDLNDLLNTLDDQEPHNLNSIAAVNFEIAKCFMKLGQKSTAAKHYMASARSYVKSAEFFNTHTPILNDLWEPSISAAIFSFQESINILIEEKKWSLLIQVYQELGEAYKRFKYYNYAGQAFQNAVNVCIANQLPPSILFTCIFKAIDCYTMDNKISQALAVVDDVQSGYQGECVGYITKSTLLTEKLMDLRIYRSILLIMAFRLDEASQFVKSNLEHKVSQYFEAICDSTKNNELHFLYMLTHPSKTDYYPFQVGHLELLNRLYQNIESSLESKLPLYTK